MVVCPQLAVTPVTQMGTPSIRIQSTAPTIVAAQCDGTSGIVDCRHLPSPEIQSGFASDQRDMMSGATGRVSWERRVLTDTENDTRLEAGKALPFADGR